jgi:hypothetical protein
MEVADLSRFMQRLLKSTSDQGTKVRSEMTAG